MAGAVKLSERKFREKSREYIASIRYARELTAPTGETLTCELGTPIREWVYAIPPNTADWAVYLGISKSALTRIYRARYPEAYEEIKSILEGYNIRELLTRKTGTDVIKFNLGVNYGWGDTRPAEDTDSAPPSPKGWGSCGVLSRVNMTPMAGCGIRGRQAYECKELRALGFGKDSSTAYLRRI